jgi:hypothetical protein
MRSVSPPHILSIAISLAFVLIFGRAVFSAGIDDLQKGFESPPDDTRIMMRWWWFGPAVTKPEIERELRVMKDAGIGGVEVQPVYPLLPDDPAIGIKNLPYLSDEFLEMLRFTAAKCKELGLRFDLTLGSGWSFGGAKTPIPEAAGQLRIERVKVDAETRRLPLPSMNPAERLLAVFARTSPPKAGPLEDNPDEPWSEVKDIHDDAVWLGKNSTSSEVMFFISGKSGMQVKRPAVGAEGYVLNHLDRPSVEDYLRTTGDRLFQAFDKTDIPYSVFCDSLEVYNQDWTDDFLAEFQKRRGYDLKPSLPALVMDIGPKTADIRYDWGRTITELFNDRFMVPVEAWSKAHGTRFRIQAYGLPPAAISSNQWADISDGEGAQWKVVRAARWASSANHIYGRNVTSSETWTWLHSPVFRATPLDIKAEADIHFLQGINQLIGHGFAYTPPQVEYPGWRFYAAGSYTEKNPWWIVMPDLTKYLQRMSYLMRQGTPQDDVALYLPNADAYARFTAGKVHLIDVEREIVGDKIMPAIFDAGYNLDFFDDDMLKTVGTVDTGVLALGTSRHRVVVLPGVDRMPLESLRKLDAFVKAGGILIATRRRPSLVPGSATTENDRAEFGEIAGRLFGGGNASVKFVDRDEDIGTALRELLQPDVAVSPSSADLGFVHRTTADAEVYFVANTSNEKRNVQITFRAVGTPELWSAVNGQVVAVDPITKTSTSTTIALDFDPYESHVIVFSKRNGLPAMKKPGEVSSTIDLSSDWKVSFGAGLTETMSRLHSWADNEATRYFSGTASYEKSVDLPAGVLGGGKMVTLDFGDGTALPVKPITNGMQTWLDPPIREAAVIYVNGQRAGSLWSPPYQLDVTSFFRVGRNVLKIVVGNTALNYMAGHRLPDYKLLNLRYGERFQAQDMNKIQVLPSGIIGSPKLVSTK